MHMLHRRLAGVGSSDSLHMARTSRKCSRPRGPKNAKKSAGEVAARAARRTFRARLAGPALGAANDCSRAAAARTESKGPRATESFFGPSIRWTSSRSCSAAFGARMNSRSVSTGSPKASRAHRRSERVSPFKGSTNDPAESAKNGSTACRACRTFVSLRGGEGAFGFAGAGAGRGAGAGPAGPVSFTKGWWRRSGHPSLFFGSF
mmetsp:Transcript_55155/g.123280  ORF Transcript_55155/g.123280 Transcript_55155/m.123280 type:complete len:205 (-) Transcript_55155:64-678(-)